MLSHNISPTIVSLFGFDIRWYGLVYFLGALASWLILRYAVKKKKITEFSLEEIDNIIFYLLLGMLIGGRLYHTFVWNFSYYSSHFFEVFKIWKGGMAFHGGVIGATLSLYIYAKIKKRKFSDFLIIGDFLAIPLAIVSGFGRIANFINQELVGYVTDPNRISWCFKFKGYDGCRHPSQLYGATKRFIIAGVLYIIKNYKLFKKKGMLFFTWFLLEFLGRFIVDFWREDVLYYGLSMGQWSSLVFCLIIGIIVFVYYRKKNN